MMEKVVMPPFRPRKTEAEIIAECPWAAQGKLKSRKANVITSLELDPAKMEENNLRFQAKYRKIEENEVRYEEFHCDDAEYLLVAFGSSARICQKLWRSHVPKVSNSACCARSRCGRSRKKPLPVMPKR